MTRLELILQALEARLRAASRATVLRDAVLPEVVPAQGLIILRDGDPGEPEVTLSPLTYHYEHVADLELIVQGRAPAAAFDALKLVVGTAVEADRTLGGLCDWIEAGAPQPTDLAEPGALPIKAGIVPVRIHYATLSPLA
jgi:hypothetical protein